MKKSYKVIEGKKGVNVVWSVCNNQSNAHRWYHLFFTKTIGISTKGMIKGIEYTRIRTWMTECSKCTYSKLETREVFLPGETIPYVI